MRDWSDEIRARLAGARLSADVEADVVQELADHLEERYSELLGRGVPEPEARARALAELGEGRSLAARLRGATRRGRPDPVPYGAGGGRRGASGVWRDVRYGARMLARTPGFTFVAVLTLALGIGANTAIFSVIDALLLDAPGGVVRPEELVLLGRTQGGDGFDTFSYPDYVDYRDGARTLSGVAARSTRAVHLSTGGASERVIAELVSPGYFEVLGTAAAHGRLFLPEDEAASSPPVVVLSYALWQRAFAGAADAVGRVVRINGSPLTVVGVAQEGFRGVEMTTSVDVFIPMAWTGRVFPRWAGLEAERGAVWLQLFGRLAPGATAAQAQAELDAIAARLQQAYPATNAERGIVVAGGIGLDPATRAGTGRLLRILLGVVALVLLIACANVTGLLLARGMAREREVALRASLGASRGRLVRQFLLEGMLLALLGGAAGLLVGAGTLRLLLRLPLFAAFVPAIGLVPDARVLAFTAAVALASGLLFSLLPALRASRPQLVGALKEGAAAAVAGSRQRALTGLVVAQLALSLVLLVGAGLLVRTLRALYSVEPGFETGQVLVATLDLGLQGYDTERARRFQDDVLREVPVLPGVEAAALGVMLPLGGGGWDTRVFPAEASPAPDDPGIKTDINAVTPAYFAALGMPITRGRGFAATDRAGSPPVAVVNDALAEQLWPGGDPVGRRFRLGRDGEVLEVIGVVPTARYRSLLEAPRPFFYRPLAQVGELSVTLHVRAAGDPLALLGPVAAIVRRLDPDLPLTRPETLADRLDRSLAQQRSTTALVGAYGLLALLLAAVGLYGSMAYAVGRRTREIGIRVALGARVDDVLRQVLGEALRILVIGMAFGLAAAIPAARLLRGQLFGVEPVDPATLVIVPLGLGLVALAAAFFPARRATRVDPMAALRVE